MDSGHSIICGGHSGHWPSAMLLPPLDDAGTEAE
jgi:hypothetical protein